MGYFTKNKFLQPQVQQIKILKKRKEKEINYKHLISSAKSSNKNFQFYLEQGILHEMLAYTRVSEIKCMLLFLVLFSHFSKIFKFLEKLSSSQETTLHGKK